MDISYGQSTDDEWDQTARLRADAFNRFTIDEDYPRVSPEHTFVARSGGRVVGTAAAAQFHQVINGADVSCAGVTGVAVAPHAAGQGVGKHLLVNLVRAAHDQSQPLASLYPTTSSFYRKLGFESAGLWSQTAVPIDAIHRQADHGYHVQAAGPEVYDTLQHLFESQALRNNGWVLRDTWSWDCKRFAADHPTRPQRILVGHGPDGPEAVAVIENSDSSELECPAYDLVATDLFGSPHGIKAIMAALASQRTVVGRISTNMPLNELASITARPELAAATQRSTWMQRIINLPKAMAARPVGPIDAELHLDVQDSILSANNGPWILHFAEGTCRAEPGGSATINIGIGDLASLYTGFASPRFLAASGKLPGANTQDLHDLQLLFATQAPTMLDFF